MLNPIASVCLLPLLILGCASSGDTAGREERPRFKGVELYGWRGDDGGWRFALLDGTNRLKSAQEVRAAATRYTGVEELEAALSRLAAGESVFWVDRVAGFDTPDDALRGRLRAAAGRAQVELRLD